MLYSFILCVGVSLYTQLVYIVAKLGYKFPHIKEKKQ